MLCCCVEYLYKNDLREEGLIFSYRFKDCGGREKKGGERKRKERGEVSRERAKWERMRRKEREEKGKEGGEEGREKERRSHDKGLFLFLFYCYITRIQSRSLKQPRDNSWRLSLLI